MRAIVFGSTGFIGKALYERLQQEGHDVLGVSRHGQDEKIDIVNDDINKIDSIVRNFNPDHIFHYAADPLVRNFTHESSLSNIVCTHKLLDVTPLNCRFVFASSMTVYGANRNIFYRTKLKPKSIYALSKLFCEQLIQKYENPYKKINQYTILRYCAHVGKEATHGLLHDIVEKLRGPNPVLELLGKKPGSLKPFIHIDDSITETLNVIKTSNNEYNLVCAQTSLTVEQVAQQVMLELGIFKPIKFLGTKSNWVGDDGVIQLYDPYRYRYSNNKPPKKYTSEEAIKKYVQDIR
jgi:UDP-glucose 4-epimerase